MNDQDTVVLETSPLRLLPETGFTLFSDGVVLELPLFSSSLNPFALQSILDDAHLDVVMSPTGFWIHLPLPGQALSRWGIRDYRGRVPMDMIAERCETLIGELGQPVTVRQFQQFVSAWLKEDMWGTPRAQRYADSQFGSVHFDKLFYPRTFVWNPTVTSLSPKKGSYVLMIQWTKSDQTL